MKDSTAIKHLAHAVRETVNRHIEEYELCTAEVVGVLDIIKMSLFLAVKKEVDDENG